VRVVSEDLEAHWRQSWLEAPEGAQTFLENLQAKFVAARRLTAGGSLSSVSKNGVSQSYALDGPSTRTTVDAERIALAALKLYEKYADATADEQVIYDSGLQELLSAPTEVFSDLTCMREVS
jgi:hypothetical protein